MSNTKRTNSSTKHKQPQFSHERQSNNSVNFITGRPSSSQHRSGLITPSTQKQLSNIEFAKIQFAKLMKNESQKYIAQRSARHTIFNQNRSEKIIQKQGQKKEQNKFTIDENSKKQKIIFSNEKSNKQQNANLFSLFGQNLKKESSQQNIFSNPFLTKVLSYAQIANKSDISFEAGYFKDKLIKISSQSFQQMEARNAASSLWLGKVYNKCASLAFKMFIEGSLDYQEAKTYCCEQILSNILAEIRRRKLTELKKAKATQGSESTYMGLLKSEQNCKIKYSVQPMKFINEESKKILNFLCNKYPQTNTLGVNKRVAEIVNEMNIDNWANDEFDLVRLSNVRFLYCESGDYSKEIMQFLNYLIELPRKKNNKQGCSNFKYFQNVMNQMFGVVYSKENGVSDDLNHMLDQNGQFKLKLGDAYNEDIEYAEKVRAYTTVQIGAKIPANTKLFSKQEIESGIIEVENNAIARVIDKWADELSEKLNKAEKLILNRSYRFKAADGSVYNKLPQQTRNELFTILNERKKKIQSFMKELKESVYDLSGRLARNDLTDVSNLTFISEEERLFGQFAVKMSQSSSEYFIQIIQKQIKLLTESVEILKRNWLNKFAGFKQSPFYESLNVDLVTCKIGDLFRCRLTSNEGEISRVLKLLMALNESWNSRLIKIIRVKNRLGSGTRDVLINFMFDDICPCEVQLTVCEKISEKQQYFDKFNHFLYELKRAYLGPIMEMSKIWCENEGKSDTYTRQIEKATKRKLKAKNITEEYRNIELNEADYQKVYQYNLPFICESCSTFYPRNNVIYFSSLLYGRIFCGNCWKIKSTLEQQKVVEVKKIYLFRKYLVRYPNFHKLMAKIQELNSLDGLLRYKYQIYIPVYSHFIHMHFAIVLRLDRNFDSDDNIEYDEYAFVSTRLTGDSQIEREVCIEKITRHEKSSLNSTAVSSETAADLFNEDYVFFSWDTPTKMLPLPSSAEGHYLQLIQKLIPHIQALQRKEGVENVKICAVEIEEGRYYFLPLFVIDEQELANEIIQENNMKHITDSLGKKQTVLEIEGKYLTTEWSSLSSTIKLRIAYTLKELYLNKNNMKSASFIENLHVLKVFQANSNQIQEIPDIPTGLEELSLMRNQIRQINAFAKLKQIEGPEFQLRILSLSYNEIERIENLSHLNMLNYIFLLSCRIRKMEGFPKNVLRLGLSMNRIEKIENLDNNSKLKKLALSYNLITRIENLDGCVNLQTLILNYNKITRIQNLSKLQNLKILHLGHIGEFNSDQGDFSCSSYDGFKYLKKLKKLSMEQNKLYCLFKIMGMADTIYQMSKSKISELSFLQMEEVSLANNQIGSIKNIEFVMPYLTTVDIQKNKITSISNITNLTTLVTVNASYNQIEQFPSSGFEKLFKLRTLNLSNNRIKLIPDLTPLIMVISLNFQSNLIVQVEKLPMNPVGNPEFSRQINLKSNFLFAEQTTSEQFSKTLQAFERLNEETFINLLQNGNSKMKIKLINKFKEKNGLSNMKVEDSPILDDELKQFQ